jgi:hypothetical protein
MGGGKIVFVVGIQFFLKQKLGHLITFRCHVRGEEKAKYLTCQTMKRAG